MDWAGAYEIWVLVLGLVLFYFLAWLGDYSLIHSLIHSLTHSLSCSMNTENIHSVFNSSNES